MMEPEPTDSSDINENGHLSQDKKCPKFNCLLCDYHTSSRKDFAKHELTRKHAKLYAKSIVKKTVNKPIALTMRTCSNCNHVFSTKGNLKKHQARFCREVSSQQEQIIAIEAPIISEPVQTKQNDSVVTNEVILDLIKKHSELQNVLMEQSAKVMEQSVKIMEMANAPRTTIVNSTTNNNNNHFNLNLFLNAKCKNAVNITDFVNSIQVQVDDLKATGRLGYVDGISRIFINALKDMEIEKRPIPCTDMKRETIYVKDQNAWEKENADKKMKSAVNHIAKMNLSQLPAWKENNPGYEVMDSPENNEYLHLSMTALGGRTDQEEEKYMNKIMKNVIKEVVIDKDSLIGDV